MTGGRDTTSGQTTPDSDGGDTGRPQKKPPQAYINTVESIPGPAFTSEVADELDVTPRTARRRLKDLANAGFLNMKAPRQTAIWWCPDNLDDRLDDLEDVSFDTP